LTSTCACAGVSGRGGRAQLGGCAVRAVAVKVFPIEAVNALVVGNAFRDLGVFHDDVVDDVVNFVIAYPNTPAPVANSVIYALGSGVTLRFHCVAAQSAGGRGTVAGAHKYGIGSMSYMHRTRIFATKRFIRI
jgi:hypothetical protein